MYLQSKKIQSKNITTSEVTRQVSQDHFTKSGLTSINSSYVKTRSTDEIRSEHSERKWRILITSDRHYHTRYRYRLRGKDQIMRIKKAESGGIIWLTTLSPMKELSIWTKSWNQWRRKDLEENHEASDFVIRSPRVWSEIMQHIIWR